MGLSNEVAVIGMGCTKFGELWDKDVKDLVVDACYEAFDDAGIQSTDLDAACGQPCIPVKWEGRWRIR